MLDTNQREIARKLNAINAVNLRRSTASQRNAAQRGPLAT